MKLLQEMGATAIMLFALTFGGRAYAQSCPGGFWGNGQCIQACEDPLVNPNLSLSFYGWQIQDNGTCPGDDLYAYPEYIAYDMAYGNLYCGVIIDWNDGGCVGIANGTFLNRFAPQRRAPREGSAEIMLLKFWSIKGSPNMQRVATKPVKQIQIHSKHYWWRHNV